MSKSLPYSLTNESVTVFHGGKSHVVRLGSPNFANLRRAIIDERWDDVPGFLSVTTNLLTWAKGRFSVVDGSIFFDGKKLPEALDRRISEMAADGRSPEPLFFFWERLQKNPSMRSVEQLWPFLQHAGIPLTDDGCFLAYKAVDRNYLDFHSHTVDNSIGVTNEMPRNMISDDPAQACHYGYHVGALEYVGSFGAHDRRIVICKVDPADVVCVPYDYSHQKMRVCKYEVMGEYGGQLSSTTHEKDMYDGYDDSDEDCSYDDQGIPSEDPSDDEIDDPAPEQAVETSFVRKPTKGFTKFDKMDFEELLKQSTDDLRKYAGRGLKIVGASKIPGGKFNLIAKIMEVRSA